MSNKPEGRDRAHPSEQTCHLSSDVWALSPSCWGAVQTLILRFLSGLGAVFWPVASSGLGLKPVSLRGCYRFPFTRLTFSQTDNWVWCVWAPEAGSRDGNAPRKTPRRHPPCLGRFSVPGVPTCTLLALPLPTDGLLPQFRMDAWSPTTGHYRTVWNCAKELRTGVEY